MGFGIKTDFNENNAGKTFTEIEKKVEEPSEEKTIEQQSNETHLEDKQQNTEQNTDTTGLSKEVKHKEEKPIELNDEQVSAYLKNKYKDRQFETLDEFITKPEPIVKEVEKIVNKYEGLIDEEDDAYFNYKKETGRTRKEFDYLKEDFSKKDALELAIDRIKNETGLNLSNKEAKEYLEDKLQIDLEDEETATRTKIELNAYAKLHRDRLISEQEKYRTPLETKIKAKENEKVEMVQLENGSKMPKAEYDILVENRNNYTKEITKAVDSVASFDFVIPIDNNGEKTNLEISYDLSKEDKHSMLSDALDVDATINKRFQTKDGFNHSELSKTLFRGDENNFNNMIVSIAEKVRAATIEEMISTNNNENFNGKSIPQSKKIKEGYGSLTGENKQNGFGVKFGS